MKSSIYNEKQTFFTPPTFPDKAQALKRVKLLVSIVDRGKGKDVMRLLKKHGSLFHNVLRGRGTARKAVLNYLGLDETKKDVVLSGIRAERSSRILDILIDVLYFDAPGRGIAFTLPITSVSGRRALSYLSGTTDDTKGYKERENMDSFKYSLLFSIVNKGFTDLVIDAANKKGARGGTILNAKGAGIDDGSNFFGITIAPEKEIVLIIVKNNSKHEIMQAIIASAGLSTAANGIIFSVPVDDAIGLSAEVGKELGGF